MKNKYPKHIASKILMEETNEEIQICNGTLVLKNKNNEGIEIEGKIVYKWFPRIGAEFRGLVKIENYKLYNNIDNDYDLFFKNNYLGEIIITEVKSHSSSNKINITGVFKKDMVIGDKSIEVNKIYFSIPNLKNFLGNSTIFNNGKGITSSRITLENNICKIEIDKALNYNKKLEKLKFIGGFDILYGGLITIKKGSKSISDIKLIINCLDNFLTFIMGRQTSSIFHIGFSNNKKIWIDYSNKINLIFKEPESWTLRNSIEGFDLLFNEFSFLWDNENDRDFLKTVIHWYVESNNYSGKIEGSIIMAQTALELIYNWFLVEKKKLIKGNDANNINAANKIRLLLSQLNVDTKVPDTLNELTKIVKKNKTDLDGPEVIVQIRNAIVHSHLEKRKKLSEISIHAKNEALKLFIWYIELSILYILKYNGKYSNRCSDKKYPVETETNVPWV